MHTLELPQQRTNWKVSSAVICGHIAVLWLMTFSFYVAAPKPQIKKLMVHTVRLQTPAQKPVVVASKPKAAIQPAQPAAAIEQPKEPEPTVAPAAAAEAPPEPASAPKIVEEKQAPEEVAPEPAKKSEPKTTPKPAAPKPEPKAQAKTTPKATPKATPKPSTKPSTKPQPKKKEVTKPQATKSKPKETSKQKEKEQALAKEKAAKEKAAQQKANQEKAAKERAAKEKAAKEQAAKQQALLDKALSSLNSASKIEGKKASVAASVAKQGTSKGPAAIGSLSAEALVAIDTSDVQNCTPQERTYYDELVSRLKLSLKLPDYGEVKLQLTVNRSGKVVSVKSVKSKSSKNSDYIQKALPKLHLPPFGQNFTGENEHTFRLTLSNEL
ncbi:MAG: hypothetical protein JSR37_06105 [Verrucomicrobia bacterium]|nr:hypothetical protein [Verrucomicrobiota bacterium]